MATWSVVDTARSVNWLSPGLDRVNVTVPATTQAGDVILFGGHRLGAGAGFTYDTGWTEVNSTSLNLNISGVTLQYEWRWAWILAGSTASTSNANDVVGFFDSNGSSSNGVGWFLVLRPDAPQINVNVVTFDATYASSGVLQSYSNGNRTIGTPGAGTLTVTLEDVTFSGITDQWVVRMASMFSRLYNNTPTLAQTDAYNNSPGSDLQGQRDGVAASGPEHHELLYINGQGNDGPIARVATANGTGAAANRRVVFGEGSMEITSESAAPPIEDQGADYQKRHVTAKALPYHINRGLWQRV